MGCAVQFSGRVRVSEHLEQIEDEIAKSVADDLLKRHPDLVAHRGARARESRIRKVRSHIGCLRGAVESGSIEAFGDYAAWRAVVLASRRYRANLFLETLKQLEEALRSRLPARDWALISPMLAEAQRKASEPHEPVSAARNPACDAYLHEILQGDRVAAGKVIEEILDSGTDPLSIYVDVFQCALYEVGRLWEIARISVATEHLAAAITQVMVSNLHLRLPRQPVRHGYAVITGVQGELHQIGANTIADVLDLHGWNVLFLGTNAPHEGIVDTVYRQDARLLGISATMLSNLPRVRRLIADVRSRIPEIRIIVGGAVFRAVPMLWKDLGADGFAPDARSALTLAERMV